MKKPVFLFLTLLFSPMGEIEGDPTCPLQRIEVQRLPDLHIPRAGHSTYCLNGEIVIFGGHTTGFVPTPTAEYYNNGRWNVIPMTYTHDQGLSLQLSSGKVMIGGGHEQDLGIGQIHSVEFYDPAHHCFEGHGCLDYKRCFADAIELDGERVIITGDWYHKDGIELFSGDPVFTSIDTTCVARSCPYLFRTAPDDAIIFSRLDTRGNFYDSIIVENIKGDTIDIPLFHQWHPFQIRPCVMHSASSFIGDTCRGEYAYLLPVENAEGELAIAKAEGTQFSIIPTTYPLPRRTPWGDIFYDHSYLVADPRAGRAYLMGHGDSRLYVLCIDYAQASTNHPAPVTLYYSDSLEVIGDNAGPVLTPEGNLVLVGGMAPDNFTPTGAAYLLLVGTSVPVASSFLPKTVVWGILLLIVVALLSYFIYTRHRSASVSQTEQPLSEETPADKADPELMRRICQLMEQQQLFLRSDLKVSDVAAELGITARRVSDAINSTQGRTFAQFVNAYRVECAKLLLREEPKRKIASVCTDSGFASESSFFRIFKEATGMTPSEWVEQEK